LNVGSGGGAAAAPTSGGAAAAAAPEEAKEEEKEEGTIAPVYQPKFAYANNKIAKEESDEDMGFGLFD